MREICLVGNSHVAALKLGLDQILAEGDISECRFSVFGTRGTRLIHAQVQGGVLQPSKKDSEACFDHRSGPHVQLRLDDYDDIYFTIGTRPDRFPHFNPYFLLNYLDSTCQQLQPLSLPLATAITHHTIHGQWFSPLLHGMLEQSSRPTVHYLGSPFLSTRAPRAVAIHAQLQENPENQPVLEDLLETIRTSVESLETERLRIPAPPPSVLDLHGCFSRQEYSQGSVRLTEDFDMEHGVRDFRHMNADYGRQIIENIIAQ